MLSLGPKIKIAEVITRMDWGGSPDIVRIISSRLDPQDYDVRLISGPTRYPSKKTSDLLNKFGPRFILIPHLMRNLNIIYDLLALIELYLIFRKEKFDIVHTHTAKGGALGRLAAFASGVPVIVHTPHGHNFYGYFGGILSRGVVFIERILAVFTDKIIALTALEKQDYLKFKLTKPSKIVLIYQGLELEDYRVSGSSNHIRDEFGIQPQEHIIGMVCRLEPVKGPEYFVEASLELLKSNANLRFMVIGEGSLRKKLEKRVAELGLKDKFIFTGWREDVPRIMAIFEILVLPSLNEAVGMVLLEAQSLGIPVVASNVGGIPEVIKDQETGILVPAGDRHSLAWAIARLLSDQEALLRMGRQAQDWVRGRFRAEDMVAETAMLYEKLLSKA